LVAPHETGWGTPPTWHVLEGILYNCRCHGPDSQNRDGRADLRAHLAGRVAYVAMINPARGRRLRALFEQIRWGPAT
jgi:hypothetical protein